MSILIKGTDMPKCSNEDIVVVIRHNGNAEVWQTGYKERTVQAIQIPTPHGRLIDEKALSKDLDNRWNLSDDQDFCNKEVWDSLKIAPTILEAEE